MVTSTVHRPYPYADPAYRSLNWWEVVAAGGMGGMRAASTPRLPVTTRVFVQRFSSTPRGARLARHLALHRLDAWGVPYGSARTSPVISTADRAEYVSVLIIST